MPPSRRPPYVTMFLVALAIRVTVTHFLYREWLDPFVLEHWAFGRIGRSLATGHGFGNPMASTGPSALLPPIYPYILAAIFKLFGVYTKSSIIAALVFNGIISSATCIPIYYLAKKNFGERAAKWAGWGWALSPYGIYYGADWAWSTPLITLLLCCLFLWSLNLEEDSRATRWFAFGLVTGAAILIEPSDPLGSSPVHSLHALSPLSPKPLMASPSRRSRHRRRRHNRSVDLPQLQTLPQTDSRTQRPRPRTLHRQQRIRSLLGQSRPPSQPQCRRAIRIRA